MRDFEIRRSLLELMRILHSHEEDTRYLEELAICGGASIADVAVVNGSMHCYEIKSQHDTLNRLTGQRESYGKAFDYVTVVASEQHIDRILTNNLVPGWWGLMIAQVINHRVAISEFRPAKENPETQNLALAQFLWRDETLDILESIGLAKGNRGKKKSLLWQILADATCSDDLGLFVRQTLKTRRNWKADEPPERCDGLLQLSATS